MKLLTIVAPGGGPARDSVSASLAAWTRGVDIRLRFLNIGVDESVVELDPAPGPGEPAASVLLEVERALARVRPAVALLHGRGPSALAAAISVTKAGVPLVRTGAGARDGAAAGEDRAADRLAAVLLAGGPGEMAALRGEGLAGEPFTPEAAVRAVLRLHREA